MIELRKIEGEKESFLCQYDTGRDVVITPKDGYRVDSIEWWNETSESAAVGIIREEDGVLYAEIPNPYLKESNRIHAYAVMYDEEERCTVDKESFVVIARVKPADYAEEPDAVLTWHELDERLRALESGNGTGSSFAGKASDVTFNNDGTELEAGNVEDAIKELSKAIGNIKTDIGDAETLLAAI